MFPFIDLFLVDGIPQFSQGQTDTKQPLKEGWVRMPMEEYEKLWESLTARREAQERDAEESRAKKAEDAKIAEKEKIDAFIATPKPTLDQLADHVALLTKLVLSLTAKADSSATPLQADAVTALIE